MQEVPVQPQQALFEQMTEFFRQMTGTVPQPQPQQKSPLGKIRKYGAVDFKGRKEDDSTAMEYWFERTEGVLHPLYPRMKFRVCSFIAIRSCISLVGYCNQGSVAS